MNSVDAMEAARIIIGGGVVVYPTETVYGLGANALDEQAVLRIFEIKRRPLDKPMSIAISSLTMLDMVAEIRDEDRPLVEKLLPGPVTLLLKKKNVVPDVLTGGSPLVGVRFPDHELAMKIIDAAGPITSTSANKTGSSPPTRLEEVSKEIIKRVDGVVDGGKSLYGKPSTLLDLSNRKVIREGAGLEEVLKAIS
jgi:L-threonylcarbamoyladenylate synthase